MYGLEAIHASNGWAMAVTGAIIVMLGLSILSFIISQLHRIIELVDGRKEKKSKKKTARDQISPSKSQPVLTPLSDLNATWKRFQPLTHEMGDPFDLAALFELFMLHDDPHPHLTIRSLREQGYLVPDGGGLFTWKQL